MKSQTSPSLSSEQLRIGVSAARRNALRLAKDALALLDAGGSNASVYTLWQFAIEEFGKSLVLERAASKAEESRTRVQVPSGLTKHWKNFAPGLEALPLTRGMAWGFAAYVQAGGEQGVIENPYGGNDFIVVPKNRIGTFETLPDSGGIIPSHDLRLRLQFVEFDRASARWKEPESPLGGAQTVGHTTIGSVPLRKALEELLAVLKPYDSQLKSLKSRRREHAQKE